MTEGCSQCTGALMVQGCGMKEWGPQATAGTYMQQKEQWRGTVSIFLIPEIGKLSL